MDESPITTAAPSSERAEAGRAALRVLIVEDNDSDALLMARWLSKAGFEVASEQVDGEQGLRDKLLSPEWDVILADYALPQFSGLEALQVVENIGHDIPVILVSGAIDVPMALAAMKAGARDFVFKDDLQRLAPIVQREVTEAAQRRDARQLAVERDRAVQELVESHERLSALARFSDFPLQGMAPTELLQKLLGRLVTILSTDGASVLLIDEGKLVVAGAVGTLVELGAEEQFGSGFAGTIAAEDRAIHLRGGEPDGHFVGEVRREDDSVSMLGVPMHWGDQVVGVMHVEWHRAYDPPAWVLPLLEMAADRCAMAIENVRLYEREHRVAESLQQALLSVPSTPWGVELGQFYEPATAHTLVGGDFYDVFDVSPGRIAVSIGDVSGKGLEAAAVTALVKNALRTHVIDGDSPAVAMAKASEVVQRFTEPEVFATAFLAMIDCRTGALTYATAGHTAPVIIGTEGSAFLDARGGLLGAFAGTQYDEFHMCLSSDETLVLYTDGLTEARGAADDFYGEERLLAFLRGLAGRSPGVVASLLREELREFTGDILRDDVAVLALRLSPPSAAASA